MAEFLLVIELFKIIVLLVALELLGSEPGLHKSEKLESATHSQQANLKRQIIVKQTNTHTHHQQQHDRQTTTDTEGRFFLMWPCYKEEE